MWLWMELGVLEEMGQVFLFDFCFSFLVFYFVYDVSLVYKFLDFFGVVVVQKFSLVYFMLVISGYLDSDDDSGFGSLVGIDNKIE